VDPNYGWHNARNAKIYRSNSVNKNMKKIISILTKTYFMLLICFATFAQQSDSIRKLPPKPPMRLHSYDVKHIAIDLQFDWDKKQAYGSSTIALSVIDASNKINLDAEMLTINSIALVNGKALKYNYDGADKNDGLEILLDRTYTSNENIIIKINYHTNWINNIDPNYLSGTNGKGLRFSKPTTNDPIKPKEIWSFGDPQSNRYWFPCYDAPDDVRTTEFIARVEKKLTVVSNGNLIETKDNKDGTHTFHYKTSMPYPNHQTAFVVSEYVDMQKKYEDIVLHNYGYAKEKDWIKASTVRLPDMMKYFSTVTAVKYPYKNYAQAFVQDIGTFNGNNGMSTISENMVDDFGTHADFFYLWDQTEAEALAQQWFGNYISAKNWSDTWLNKSLARRLQQLYNDKKNGRDEFLLYLITLDQSAYFADWNAGYRHPIVTEHFDNVYNFTTDNYATYRGNLVLNMLHKQLGDKKWWKAIQLYTKNNAGKLVTTKDFQHAVNQASGKNLDWFFDQWIYKMGHPIFEVIKNYDAIKKQLTFIVKQTQTIDAKDAYPQVDFFKGNIEIEIDEKIETVWIEPKEENQFNFTIAQKPTFVNFDYESTWIKEIKVDNTLEQLINISKNSKDALARQTAMQEMGTLAKKEKTVSTEKEKIKTTLQEIILSKAYWRLRTTAMAQLRGIFAANSEKIDAATIAILLKIVKSEKAYIKGVAINFLGMTKDEKYVGIYLNALNDPSDRVINLAAIALGKTKSPRAFDALAKLANKTSMKSQSLLCTIAGLKELQDPRGFDIAFKALSNTTLPRWRLPDGSIWDYRIFAAQLIASLGKSSEAYPLIMKRCKKSMAENDLEGMLNNIVIINTLADPRGQELYDLIKAKFKDNNDLLTAIKNYETQFKNAIKK
jgi:aminopeptidase N